MLTTSTLVLGCPFEDSVTDKGNKNCVLPLTEVMFIVARMYFIYRISD